MLFKPDKSSCVIKNIKTRRTIYEFSSQKLPSELLEQCLEAAIWAPNHKMTQPWRFWMIGLQTQQALGEIYATLRTQKKSQQLNIEDLEGQQAYQNIYEKAYKRFLTIPKIIIVGQSLSEDCIQKQEDYAACACAIQNFQLAAWSMDIGVQWSTGPLIRDQRTYEKLQVSKNEVCLIGALYCGYPKTVSQSQRQPLQRFITVMK